MSSYRFVDHSGVLVICIVRICLRVYVYTVYMYTRVLVIKLIIQTLFIKSVKTYSKDCAYSTQNV